MKYVLLIARKRLFDFLCLIFFHFFFAVPKKEECWDHSIAILFLLQLPQGLITTLVGSFMNCTPYDYFLPSIPMN